MERGVDLSRRGITALAQIPSDVVRQLERSGAPYALSLAQNHLVHLAEIHFFRNVVQLDLSGNALQTLDGIESLQLLESLNLARNNLDAVDALAELPRLRVLHAAENNLMHVDALRFLKELVVVDVSCNNINKWPQLRHLPLLESVDLSSNLLEAFPPAAASRVFPRSLQRLAIAKNQIHELCGIASLGRFLPQLQTLKLDGNPAIARVQRDGGSLDFLFVNFFDSVALVNTLGHGAAPRRSDFVVPDEIVMAVDQAIRRSDEHLLCEFLLNGTVSRGVSRTPPPPPRGATPALDAAPRSMGSAVSRGGGDRAKADEVSHASATGALTKESKMDMWKRLTEERRLQEQQQQQQQQRGNDYDIVAPPPAPLPLSVKAIERAPAAPPPAAIPQQYEVQTLGPTASTPAASQSVGASAPPPATASLSTSMEQVVTQVKALSEQVAGMRKYVKVWIKREQLARETAARRIQRCVRRRQRLARLARRVKESRIRREAEYNLQHLRVAASMPRPAQIPAHRLPLHLAAQVIQRNARGWLARYRVSRWMYYSQAAQRIQVEWRRRVGARLQQQRSVRHQLQLQLRRRRHPPHRRHHSDQRDSGGVAMDDALVRVVGALAGDLQQLQRVLVVQERAMASMWSELARYRRFFERKRVAAVTKLQSAWRGYKARQALQIPRRLLDVQCDDRVDELRNELEQLKRVVQRLVDGDAAR